MTTRVEPSRRSVRTAVPVTPELLSAPSWKERDSPVLQAAVTRASEAMAIRAKRIGGRAGRLVTPAAYPIRHVRRATAQETISRRVVHAGCGGEAGIRCRHHRSLRYAVP